jgi:hypothetical protein
MSKGKYRKKAKLGLRGSEVSYLPMIFWNLFSAASL